MSGVVSEREAIARIVDPKEWHNHDGLKKVAAIYPVNAADTHAEASRAVAPSLAKADAILAHREAHTAGLDWQPIETAPTDYVTEIDLWCEGSGDREPGWLMRGILYPGQPQWLKRDDATDYFPHENGGHFTHWRRLPAPPATDAAK